MLGLAVVVLAAALGGFISPAEAAMGAGCLGMIDVVTVGHNFSPRAYCGDENGVGRTQPPQAILCSHLFTATNNGQLVHEIDGHVRALVPPEGFDGYVEHWPAAGEIVRQLRAAGEAKQRAAAEARTALEADMRAKLTAEITAQVLADIASRQPAG